MSKRNPTDKELYVQWCADLKERVDRWCTIMKEGGNDPNWCDGTNLNLVRNQIIFGKAHLKELCKKLGCDLPIIAKVNVPPLVPYNLMISKERAEKVFPNTKVVFGVYHYRKYKLTVRRKTYAV